MDLKDARENYNYFSAQASTVVRQLSFAGIAIIWIFSGSGEPVDVVVPQDLLVPGLLLVAALASDLLQYVAGALPWGVYQRWREWKDKPDPFVAPRQINWPGNTFFGLKLLTASVAYLLLLVRVADRLTT